MPSQGRDRSRVRGVQWLRDGQLRDSHDRIGRVLRASGSRGRLTRSLPTSKLAGHTLPAAGGGGVGGWFTAITSHHLSTTALVAGTVIVCVALIVRGIPKIMKRFYKHREAILKVRNDGQDSKAREENAQQISLQGLEDPAKAARAQKMLAARTLAELHKGRKLTDEDIQYAKLLAALGEAGSAAQDEPEDRPGGELRSAG